METSDSIQNQMRYPIALIEINLFREQSVFFKGDKATSRYLGVEYIYETKWVMEVFVIPNTDGTIRRVEFFLYIIKT